MNDQDLRDRFDRLEGQIQALSTKVESLLVWRGYSLGVAAGISIVISLLMKVNGK